MLRFLVDENLPGDLAARLTAAGHPAQDVRDVGLTSAKDSVVFAYAQKNGLVLITGDQGFANTLQYAVGTHYGVVVTQFPTDLSAPTVCALLIKALSNIPAIEIERNLVVIDSLRIRITRSAT
jgi:predicted nuclease of predicted toxin-antitoxin system